MNLPFKHEKQDLLDAASKIRSYISSIEEIAKELGVDISNDNLYIAAKAYKKAIDDLINKK